MTKIGKYIHDRIRINESGCWLWTGSRTKAGYGTCHVAGIKTTAHRLSYQHFVGAIPDGLEIDHKCRVLLCVNPEHIEPVTHLENVRRVWRGVTTCVAGHEFDSENTYIKANGCRSCRKCNAARQAAARKKDPERYRNYSRSHMAKKKTEVRT